MTSSWHGRVSAQEGRSPLHGIANSGRHRNGCYGADFNYPQGENSLSFFQTVEVGLINTNYFILKTLVRIVLICGSKEFDNSLEV